MSRMTAAQVVALGEYLNPDFDPATLTVNQLLGVFGFHNINFPAPYTKPKLVQLFNDEIKAKATKFKKERVKKENSIPSDDGITDGVTGKPLTDRSTPAPRRSSRRVSRAPTEEPADAPPARPDPPKRRRSSAQPSLGGPSRRKAAPVQPALAEESEEDEQPAPKASRGKKNVDDAGSKARRISPTIPEDIPEDSVWEDNNVFQSGAESSSPARPSPAKTRAARKTSVKPAVSRKSRKASSAPPQGAPSPTKDDDRHGIPETDFNPLLSPSVDRANKKIANLQGSPRRLAVPSMVEEEDELEEQEVELPDDEFALGSKSMAEVSKELLEGLDDEDDEDDDVSAEDAHNAAVSNAITEQRSKRPRSAAAHTPVYVRVLGLLALLLGTSAVWDYKTESASIGFCDTGSNSNAILQHMHAKINAIDTCNRANSSLVYLPPIPGHSMDGHDGAEGNEGALIPSECPPLPLVPLPHPDTCTPCPAHASCTRRTVVCDDGYLLRPHPLLALLPPPPSTPSSVQGSPVSSSSELAWKVISTVTDGLPGLGPVAFPPRCLEDPKRRMYMGVLGRAMKSILAQERGRRLCSGEVDGVTVLSIDGGEAKKWGMELEALKEAMKRKTPAELLDTYDHTFHKAVEQLMQWGGVVSGEDAEGRKYLAHETPDMPWNCVVTVKARETWHEWRTNVLGAAAVLITAVVARARRARRQVEDKRAAELVQIALDTLRNQELAHHTDPITAPHPYLSSLQLRDLVLQDEHSVSVRRSVWDRVERVVEGNANVRVNLEEVAGGDEMRVWRWVGSAGGPRKSIAFAAPAEADDRV